MATSETLIDLAKSLSAVPDTQNAGVLTKQDVINLVNTRVAELLAAIAAVDDKVRAPAAASVSGLSAAIETAVVGLLTEGTGITLTHSEAGHTLAVSATGTVSSVGLSLPVMFTVTGSPVTTSGTLTATLANQSANTLLAGPAAGASAAPTFRALVPADLPTVPVAQGGTGLTALVAGDLLIATAATTLTRLPKGTEGQALIVSPAGLPAWGTHIPSGVTDAVAVEDWLTANAAGRLGWTSDTNGDGAATACNGTGVNGTHWGTVDLSTGTATSGRAALHLGPSTLLLGGALCQWEWEVYLSDLSDGTDTYTVRVGLLDSTTGTPTDGVYFIYNHLTSPNWICRTISNGSATETITSVPVAATTWTSLSAEINAAGNEAKFYIDYALVATLTTNIPVGVGRLCGPHAHIIKSAGTNARTLTADYFWLHGHNTGR